MTYTISVSDIWQNKVYDSTHYTPDLLLALLIVMMHER
jgi:hypothetical protein